MSHNHKSLNEVAYGMIKEQIIQGKYELGSRIREDHLAEEISMSRTPVREAINRLVSEGLIINRARKGLYLIDPSIEEIGHYIDIRIALEKLAVEKCIETATDEQLAQISDALDEFEFRLKKEKYDFCNQLDGEFHLLIAELSGNTKLHGMLQDLSSFFLQTRVWEKKVHPQEKNERTLREHKIIYEAIRNRDCITAMNAIADNIDTMRSNLRVK
jgi:DNA-binding GntR family transcriptional regulator